MAFQIRYLNMFQVLPQRLDKISESIDRQLKELHHKHNDMVLVIDWTYRTIMKIPLTGKQ